MYKGCDLIPTVAGADAGKVVCRSAVHIARIVVVILYFAAHTVSFD